MDRVADADVVEVFDRGDDESHLAGPDLGDLHRTRHELAHVGDLVPLAVAHEADLVALFQSTIDQAHVGDDAAVVVVERVEDQRAWRPVRIAARARQAIAQRGDEFGDADAGLRAAGDRIFRSEAQDLLGFFGDVFEARAWQIDLVHTDDHLEARFHRGIRVGHRLRLNALRAVDDKNRPFTRLQRPLHFVVEVHMPRRVDEVQHELLAAMFMEQP